jgi:two-component system, chemotaxis family, protein-glutamate methylesterase/glutaminase
MAPAASALDAVVVGGSAGALDALLALLRALPASFGAPLLVVVHVPQRRSSSLAAALEGAGRPVVEVEDKLPIERGAVYVAPPDYHVLVEAGRPPSIALSADEPVNHSIPSIDVLFQCAAEVYGRSLAGVVLSGANEDGAAGLAAVVAHGGHAFVQAPETARVGTMPLAALAACPGARVLPPAQMAVELAGLAAGRSVCR